MLRRLILVLPLLCSVLALAAEVTDSTGRSVQVPDRIMHVVPAGPPAAVLLEAIAPDLMAGWPGPLAGSDPATRETLMRPDAWKSARSVRDGHAFVATALPFGRVEEPPSINRPPGWPRLDGRS
jgi:hypothetical protein